MIDIRELARLFVYDPAACEKFISSIIDSVDIDKSGTLSFSEFLMLMVKQEGLEGVKQAFQVKNKCYISAPTLSGPHGLNF